MIHDREDLDDDAMLDEGEEASVVDEVEASEGHGLDGVSGAVDLEVDDESDLTGLTADLEADEDSALGSVSAHPDMVFALDVDAPVEDEAPATEGPGVFEAEPLFAIDASERDRSTEVFAVADEVLEPVSDALDDPIAKLQSDLGLDDFEMEVGDGVESAATDEISDFLGLAGGEDPVVDLAPDTGFELIDGGDDGDEVDPIYGPREDAATELIEEEVPPPFDAADDELDDALIDTELSAAEGRGGRRSRIRVAASLAAALVVVPSTSGLGALAALSTTSAGTADPR